jgi:hypothetical protein
MTMNIIIIVNEITTKCLSVFRTLYSRIHKQVGFYLMWIILHFVCTHIYVYMCVPLTITGFIMSPLITMNPLCTGLQWVTYNSLSVMSNMWIGIGMWITTNVLLTTYEALNIEKIDCTDTENGK